MHQRRGNGAPRVPDTAQSAVVEPLCWALSRFPGCPWLSSGYCRSQKAGNRARPKVLPHINRSPAPKPKAVTLASSCATIFLLFFSLVTVASLFSGCATTLSRFSLLLVSDSCLFWTPLRTTDSAIFFGPYSASFLVTTTYILLPRCAFHSL